MRQCPAFDLPNQVETADYRCSGNLHIYPCSDSRSGPDYQHMKSEILRCSQSAVGRWRTDAR